MSIASIAAEIFSPLLSQVNTPADLKRLSLSQLEQLSEEIRQEVIKNVSQTGGHLASNLGVVEITLALHYVFDTLSDRVLWDVGHQAYIHKMLTGRKNDFTTLRKYKGLSGFINPLESEHDHFLAGHSSTALSLAVGMSIARDHFEKNHKVIALIGDGGLTGGMALEAINHLGHIGRDVLIILNDNEMSISENLGGFAQYMKRIKRSFFYKDIKHKIEEIEVELGGARLEPQVWNMINAVKEEAKERFDTPGIVFDKLGVNYSGPVDGHNVAAIVEALNNLKTRHQPQILHVITQKGKGYEPAEQDAIKYHGVSAFSLAQNVLGEKVEPKVQAVPKAKTYSDVFTQSLIDIADTEPDLVAITPATAEGSGLVKFGKIYPDRFFDVAICEQHAVTMAAGMAAEGLKPVVSIYSTFLQRAMDQVIHDVAILNLPVLFGIDRGGLVEDGETHQGVFDIAYLRSIPNFTLLAPKDASELQDMVYTAIKRMTGPVAIRFPRDKAARAQENHEYKEIDYKRWEVVHGGDAGRDHNDCTDNRLKAGRLAILAYGAMVETALQALPLFEQQGINPTIVNARCCKPLDEQFLDELIHANADADYSAVLTVEEGVLAGGFGSAILEWSAKVHLKQPKIKQPPIFCLGIEDHFVEHGARNILLELNGLSPDKIVEFAMGCLAG